MLIRYFKKNALKHNKRNAINFRNIKGKLYCDFIKVGTHQVLSFVDVKKFLTSNRYANQLLTKLSYEECYNKLVEHESNNKNIESIELSNNHIKIQHNNNNITVIDIMNYNGEYDSLITPEIARLIEKEKFLNISLQSSTSNFMQKRTSLSLVKS
ncbi:hypothetical protein L3V83_09165 [Thiotrichales bacterium 19X7-9]|nr:hypothetical protein [Thiotrichales bacterium 19X7-9]TNF66537.1 MAG: hypothetical protein EP298_08785 [Gammaproteobacteria bacterium]UTW43132.1 hypothetical protein KFE69_03020 [bacterium SCSIO 12844]